MTRSTSILREFTSAYLNYMRIFPAVEELPVCCEETEALLAHCTAEHPLICSPIHGVESAPLYTAIRKGDLPQVRILQKFLGKTPVEIIHHASAARRGKKIFLAYLQDYAKSAPREQLRDALLGLFLHAPECIENLPPDIFELLTAMAWEYRDQFGNNLLFYSWLRGIRGDWYARRLTAINFMRKPPTSRAATLITGLDPHHRNDFGFSYAELQSEADTQRMAAIRSWHEYKIKLNRRALLETGRGKPIFKPDNEMTPQIKALLERFVVRCEGHTPGSTLSRNRTDIWEYSDIIRLQYADNIPQALETAIRKDNPAQVRILQTLSTASDEQIICAACEHGSKAVFHSYKNELFANPETQNRELVVSLYLNDPEFSCELLPENFEAFCNIIYEYRDRYDNNLLGYMLIAAKHKSPQRWLKEIWKFTPTTETCLEGLDPYHKNIFGISFADFANEAFGRIARGRTAGFAHIYDRLSAAAKKKRNSKQGV